MRRLRIDILLLCVGVALGVTLLAPAAWLVVLTDGLSAAAVVAGAIGWGAWPVVWLGLRRRPALAQVCIAAALGLGWLGTVTLALGVAGWLSPAIAWGLLAIGGFCGLLRLARASRSASERRPAGRADRVWRVPAALVLVVPLAIGLVGAALPPGVLWPEEAFGYDVLEYHLQAPREYYDAGRIHFLPHNVYAAFPEQMEMLYLLLMYLGGGAHAAAIPAQFLHTACGMLAAMTLAGLLPPGRGRLVALVAAGATPWVAYLGALAYVENGVLLFAAVAGGLALEAVRGEHASRWWRVALAAGICAGLAGACKYTAIAMVSAALGLAWIVAMRGGWKARLRTAFVYGMGTLVALAPWLVRNGVQAGNPVYPFAYSWLGGRAWSTAQAAQWSRAHRVAAQFDSPTGRLRLGVRELVGRTGDANEGFVPSLFGVAVLLAGVAGLVVGCGRARVMPAVWAGLIVAVWLGLTFIPGRFAVPLIVPLALLGGTGLSAARGGPGGAETSARTRRLAGVIVPAVVLVGGVAGDAILAGRYRAAAQWFTRTRGVPLAAAVGQTAAMVKYHPLNEALPADAYLWLLGDARAYYIMRRVHYTVVFNRDPWVRQAAGGASPAACVRWLQARGVTHVVVAWSEIERLRDTYGFSPIVTRAWLRELEHAGLERVDAGPACRAAGYEVYRVRAPR